MHWVSVSVFGRFQCGWLVKQRCRGLESGSMGSGVARSRRTGTPADDGRTDALFAAKTFLKRAFAGGSTDFSPVTHNPSVRFEGKGYENAFPDTLSSILKVFPPFLEARLFAIFEGAVGIGRFVLCGFDPPDQYRHGRLLSVDSSRILWKPSK